MSDFFKKAAGLFFTIEDSDEQKKKPEAKETTRLSAATPVNVPSFVVADDKIIEKFRSYFKTMYESANLPGPDFFEFNTMTEAMGNAVPDDIKYASVYAGFAGQVNKEKLLTTGEQYLTILQNDIKEFEHSLQTALKTKVLDRRTAIQNKAEEIKKLQERIAAINNEIIELNKSAQEDEAHLTAEKGAYYQQSAEWQQKIKTGIDKINQYIR